MFYSALMLNVDEENKRGNSAADADEESWADSLSLLCSAIDVAQILEKGNKPILTHKISPMLVISTSEHVKTVT